MAEPVEAGADYSTTTSTGSVSVTIPTHLKHTLNQQAFKHRGGNMPALGLLAILQFFRHIFKLLWKKEAFRGLFAIVLGTIGAGTWFYYHFEPTITTWVDAYYFTVITLTTIGYGDMGPTTPATRIFTTFYAFIGLGIIAGLIGLVGETVVENANKARK